MYLTWVEYKIGNKTKKKYNKIFIDHSKYFEIL